MFEALEVNIRRAPLDGVGEDGVDQFDNRRVVYCGGQRGGRDIFLPLFDDFDIPFEVRDVIQQRRHSGVAGVVLLVDYRSQRDLTRQHRVDVVASYELEVIKDPEVGGIGDSDGQRSPIPLERKDKMLGRDIGRNELDDARIDLELGQVNRRHS